MVIRVCEICKKEFKKKFDYDCHSNRKYKCEPINEIIDIENNSQNSQILSNNSQKFSKNTVNIIDNENIDTRCQYCNKESSNKYNLQRHIVGCKKKHDKKITQKSDKDSELQNQILELKQEIEKLKNKNKIINNNNNTINNNNNTINNNINIINLTDFDKELDHKIIGKKIFFDSISKYSGLKPLLEFITYVHKNDNNTKLLPYKNVKITDLGRNLGQIVKNNKWEVEDANDIVDKVVDDTYNYFEVQYETNEDEIEEKPANIKNKFKRFKKFYFSMRGPEFFEMNDDGDRVDDDGQLVTPTDFKNGKLFEVKLKKKAKMILKE